MTCRCCCPPCAAEGIGRVRVANRSFGHAQEVVSALCKTGAQAEALSSHLFVCDLAYNPLRTRLLEDAAQAGCRILNGFDMSVYQGARQFQLLTGKIPPLDVMFDVMRQQLQ